MVNVSRLLWCVCTCGPIQSKSLGKFNVKATLLGEKNIMTATLIIKGECSVHQCAWYGAAWLALAMTHGKKNRLVTFQLPTTATASEKNFQGKYKGVVTEVS